MSFHCSNSYLFSFHCGRMYEILHSFFVSDYLQLVVIGCGRVVCVRLHQLYICATMSQPRFKCFVFYFFCCCSTRNSCALNWTQHKELLAYRYMTIVRIQINLNLIDASCHTIKHLLTIARQSTPNGKENENKIEKRRA